MSTDPFVAALMARVNRQVREEAEENGQMTLGAFIKALSHLPADMIVTTDQGGGLDDPTSYRGFYEQLAFQPTSAPVTAGSALTTAIEALGGTFQGYKGGDFRMREDTMIWLASWGDTGRRIVSVSPDGVVGTAAYD